MNEEVLCEIIELKIDFSTTWIYLLQNLVEFPKFADTTGSGGGGETFQRGV